MSWSDLLYQDEEWVDRNGTSHRISEMDERYCRNIIRFLERVVGPSKHALMWDMLRTPMPSGEQAAEDVSNAMMMEMDLLSDNPQRWLEDTPLYQALLERIGGKEEDLLSFYGEKREPILHDRWWDDEGEDMRNNVEAYVQHTVIGCANEECESETKEGSRPTYLTVKAHTPSGSPVPMRIPLCSLCAYILLGLILEEKELPQKVHVDQSNPHLKSEEEKKCPRCRKPLKTTWDIMSSARSVVPTEETLPRIFLSILGRRES